jgi:DNA (cytosine-5)-methyltransferase 1
LGERDERNLFPTAIDIIDQVRPRAVMIENVRGFLDAVFADYRTHIAGTLKKLGYTTDWRLLNASDYGVSQLRPRVVFIAVKSPYAEYFTWPEPKLTPPPTVGEALFDLISSRGWKGAKIWRERANEIAPTLVGGSKKHGGPDLGPTRSKRAWASLSVDGHGVVDEPPVPEFVGMPRLTVQMVARLQGFPDGWIFEGRKTNAYRQVGNAFPPPVAFAVARQLAMCLAAASRLRVVK